MSRNDYSKLQVGFVGAGLMGRWHAKIARQLGAKPVAVMDQDLSRASSLSDELGGKAEIFTDMDDMLSKSQLDIVHICTPTDSHYQIAGRLIDAGIHVLVEKPAATSLVETRELLRTASRQGVNLCPVHQFAFQDGVIHALAGLGSLGELLNVRFVTGSAGGKTRSTHVLNEIVADIIPHPLSVLQRLRPGITLDTRQWQGIQLRQGELQLIGDADGVVIDIFISMGSRPTRCEMDLFCSKGRVYLNFFHGYAVIEKGVESRAQKVIQPFRYALKEFFLAGGNIAKRGLHRQFAYPGLGRLLDGYYQAVATGAACPIAAEDVLAIASARDDLAARFLQRPPAEVMD